tara:strand:+ start:421 stop:1134 length:714 start_codon:yes stop_codon:yes gene_type:complete
MNQIISQHGWAFDSSLWKELKKIYIKNKWIWQDGERGYFNKTLVSPKWINNNSNKGKNIIIIHSLGIHLIDKNTLINASHAIFINSFYQFIPDNKDRKLIIKSLERMKKKLNNQEIKPMLNEFYKNSFFPNEINLNFKETISSKFDNANISQLKSDFDKLMITNKPPLLVSKDCNVLIIKSTSDRILNNNSSKSFIELMSKTQTKKPRILEIENHGHIINNYKIFNLIDNWIENKYD